MESCHVLVAGPVEFMYCEAVVPRVTGVSNGLAMAVGAGTGVLAGDFADWNLNARLLLVDLKFHMVLKA